MAVCIHYTLNCAGGRVVHSYGRLIPHEFPITDLQQISGPDGIGRITCTVSSGRAMFFRYGVSKPMNVSTLVVNSSNGSFENRAQYCINISATFYLYISSASKYSTTSLLESKQHITHNQPYAYIQVLLYYTMFEALLSACFQISLIWKF